MGVLPEESERWIRHARPELIGGAPPACKAVVIA